MILTLLLMAAPVFAADAEAPAKDVPEEAEAKSDNGDGISGPKTMSGMSILGNEETPKSLVIVPWKSSEMGDSISLTDTLDDRATPVDKEVFLREVRYYEIRKSER
jgi:hypothetical protein